jgi:hypothetical protein
MLSIQYLSFNILFAGLTDTQSFLNPEVLIPIFGVLLPVFIILIVFVSDTKKNKYKYDALIEISKNVKDSEEISGLLNSFKESKKSNTDLRRTGLVTLFTGIGLAALGKFGLSLDVLFGVGLLVMFIGFGQIIAGYVYPNTGSELTNAVDDFEKK